MASTGLIDRLAADLETQGHAAGTAAAIALNTARRWVKDPGLDIREAVKLVEARTDVNRSTVSAHATPDELEKVGRKAQHRLALAEGLKVTLEDSKAKHGMAYVSAQAFFNGGKAKVSLNEPEPVAADVREMLGRLTDEIETNRLLVEAVPSLRSPKGQFHGMHGMERRANKGKLLKGEGAAKCEHCGALKPSADSSCPKGGDHKKLAEAFNPADADFSLGGGNPIQFDPNKHPRDRAGKFANVLKRLGTSLGPRDITTPGTTDRAKLPSGVTVEKGFGPRLFHITDTRGKKHSVVGAKRAARLALAAHDAGGKLSEAMIEEADSAHDAKPKKDRECKMPHDSLSKQGKRKCPACGANIGQRQKTMEEADAAHPLANYAPNVHFNPEKHPRDKVGRFAQVLRDLAVGVSFDGAHEAELPSGVSVQRTALGGHFIVEGKQGNGKQKYKDPETAALAALLADKMGGKVLTEVELVAERKRVERLLEEAPKSNAAAANKVANEIAGTAGVVNARVKTGGATRSGAADVSAGVRAAVKNDPNKPNARGGGDPNSDFEKKHPRGRGGVWIKKGQGTAQNPDPQVSQLQKRLQQLGYGPGAADGQFGPLTEAAVAKFQTDYGLRATGEVDPATLQTMQQPPAQKLADVQAANARIAQLPNAQGQVPTSSGASGSGGTHSRAGGGAAAKGAASGFNAADPNSVRAFQQAHGLTVDGVVGPQTQAALRSAGVGGHTGSSSGSRSAHGSKGSGTKGSSKKGSGKQGLVSQGAGMSGKPDGQVRQIQKAIENLGYGLGDGGVDGRFGPDTRRAIEKLQRQHGLEADGVVGPKTRRLIEKLAKRANKPKSGIQSADVQLRASVWEPMLKTARELVELAEADRDEEAYVRARAFLISVEEATFHLPHLGRGGGDSTENLFDPNKHPRDRRGKFAKVVGKLKVGDTVKLPDGSSVHRESGSKLVVSPVSGVPSTTTDVSVAVKRIVGDANWLSPQEMNARAMTPKERVQHLKHGESAAVGGHKVSRGPFGGYYVDDRPLANADDAAYEVTRQRVASDAEHARLRDEYLGNAGRRRKRALVHVAEVTMSNALNLRLEEATADRMAAEYLGDTTAFTDARAREATVAQQIIEGRSIPAEERKKHAAVVVDGQPKFPIRPGNKQDAKSALKLVNHAKPPLTPDQKKKVVRKAKASLAEADEIFEGVEIVEGVVLEEGADTPRKASQHEPVGHGGRNWITTMGEQLPAYIQHIANDLREKRGKSESNAIQMAIGIVKNWASGKGNVGPEVRAAAAKAVAQWEALKAKNKARKIAAADTSYDDDPAHQAMVKRLKKKGIPHDVAHKMATRAVGNKKISEAYHIDESYLEEGFPNIGRSGLTGLNLSTVGAGFDPKKHPRGRHGQFVDVLAKLRAGVDVKLPHGTTLHPMDSVTNKIRMQDVRGSRHEVLGMRFAAALGIEHDRHMPPLPKASPAVGKKPQVHVPQADATNRNFLHDVETMKASPPVRLPPLKNFQSPPDIHDWPRDPDDLAAQMRDRALKPRSWKDLPQEPSPKGPDLSRADIARLEMESYSPEQRQWLRDHPVGKPQTGETGYHMYQRRLATIEKKYQGKTDDQLRQQMSAIKDPVKNAAEISDLSLEMRRRQGVAGREAQLNEKFGPSRNRFDAFGELSPDEQLKVAKIIDDYRAGRRGRRVEATKKWFHEMTEAAADGDMQPSEDAVPTNAIQAVADPDAIRTLPLAEIAHNIATDWGPSASFAAISFLDAMRTARDQSRGLESPSPMIAVVRNFLQNAGDWSGPVADVVKPELARRLRAAEEG